MKNLYADLLEILKNSKWKNSELHFFHAQTVKNSSPEIMIIGRAVNDWQPFTPENTSEFSFDSKWSADFYSNFGDGYTPNRSAFWRTARQITATFTNSDYDSCIPHLVYSNLYKIATSCSNPPNDLQILQRKICFDILKIEIKQYRPRQIIFLTDLNWCEPFIEEYYKTGFFTKKQLSNNIKHIKTCGFIPEISAKYFVLPHPQCKPEKEICQELFSVNKELVL